MNYRHLLVVVLGCAILSAVAWGQAKKKATWFLAMNVEGKEVKLDVQSAAFYVAPDEGDPDTFALLAVAVNLDGKVDVNGDGTLDGKDKLAVDAEGEAKPESAMNKKVFLDPTREQPGVAQNSVTLPGHGPCAILKGSTLTLTKFRKTGKSDYVFSGTADLKLKTKKGQELGVQGRWEAGTGAEG